MTQNNSKPIRLVDLIKQMKEISKNISDNFNTHEYINHIIDEQKKLTATLKNNLMTGLQKKLEESILFSED
jgi:hypothetical protein